MSQKAGKRTRKNTGEEQNDPKNEPVVEKVETPSTNGGEAPKNVLIDEEKLARRSKTPQLKKTTNGTSPETVSTTEIEPELKTNGHVVEKNGNESEMDALVLTVDEPCPELEFDENSDLDSVSNNSPIISRCKTRRSQTRNVPTPKTPKIFDEIDETLESVEKTIETDATPKKTVEKTTNLDKTSNFDKTANLDETTDSSSSTTAQVGSDSTRLEFTEKDLGESDFLSKIKSQSFTEVTKLHVSARKTIRPLSDDIRKRMLRNNLQNKTDFERAPSVKRKSRSETPESNKRSRTDSYGLLGYLSTPLANLRNRFARTDLPTSTPKLMSYKDHNITIDNAEIAQEVEGERKWCSIM